MHRVKRIGILVERKKEDAVTFRKLRLLMSKYGFSILFMGFELWASFAAFFWLNRWFPHWLSVAVIGLLYVSTILAIVNRNTPPENKVTWLLIAVIPVFGSLLYLMFGERRLSKKEMIQLKNMESMKFREDNSHQLRKELKQESKAVYGLVKSILSMDHNADLYNGTASTFYPLGEEMYEQLLEDLKAAKKFIFIEFYIIDEGLMWNSILEILEQKVKEGVEVKLLYDDIGCMATLAGNYTKRLRKMGIDAHKFNKVIPRMTVAYNNRDHRKILVIDGGFSRAYQKETGIAGYTLIYNSWGMILAAHEPFTSTQDAITKESDILSDSILVKRVTERKNVGATDTGAKLKERIAELKELLDAYRNGLLVEKL